LIGNDDYEKGGVSNEGLDDTIDNAAGKVLEGIGSVAFWGMRIGDIAADKTMQLREAAIAGAKLTEETALAVAYVGAGRVLEAAKKLFDKQDTSDEVVEVDGIPVLPDQQHGLDMLATEHRESARNMLAGSTMFSIDQQLRDDEGHLDTAEAPRERFVKLAVVEAGFGRQEARHLASLPDPRRITDN
jgi:hypothetical protein